MQLIAEAERLRPDVVLMDIELDDHGDGTEAAREICERFDIPSLFTTGGVDHETWRRAMLTRPVGYLQKPVLPSELGALLDNLSPSPAIVTNSAKAVQAAVEPFRQPVQTSPNAAQVSAGEPPLAKLKPEPEAVC
ncbi:MAG: response regulator [bacterium]